MQTLLQVGIRTALILELFKRAQELEIEEEFESKISKFKEFKSILKEKQKKGPTGELVTVEFVICREEFRRIFYLLFKKVTI